ncbi:hypothetical protein VitviT2T_001946 [Vitis vinifera]|uniref:Protein kinase domain-containing protein n=5 Tax=Vitis vinifera TaxID=29760 RepID=A0ABY9BHM3_VITVI|nr:hypothetical protein VitviT2T_001946 [Vitis vinifera]
MAPSNFTINKSERRVSNPHDPGTASGLFVCGCWSCWRILSIILLTFPYQLAFCVASDSPPTRAAPPTPLFKTRGGGDTQSTDTLADPRIVAALCVSAAFLILLFVMGFLKFLRFKLRRRRNRVVIEDHMGGCESGISVVPNEPDKKNGSVKRFSREEIERVTMNFSQTRVIGSGGFSTVYLAHFPGSTMAAVKIHNGGERLNRVFKQELEILLHLDHDNIVKLLGYGDDREEGVLVFEHVPKGSLQEMLHDSTGAKENSPLSWKNRMAIAFQLAEAIEYLHEKCALPIVHGDIKASNILLDEHLNCKLCDFGSAKMGFSSTVLPPSSSRMNQVMMMGSPGYVDPHYLRTGIPSKKNDIYSFGVILLELLTGMDAFCSEREQPLTSIAGPILRDASQVGKVVDPGLGGYFDLEEAKVMASMAGLCLGPSPTLRPSASDILQTMKHKISSISFLFSPHHLKL